MKSGSDATRRNRNIGTAKRGYGQNNKLVIPFCGPNYGRHYENLKNIKHALREIHGVQFTFIVEQTRADSYHACTVDDIAYMLRQIPPPDLAGVELVVLRQTKRKEEILNSVWGRWVREIEIGRYRGSALILESVPLSKPVRWTKSLVPDFQMELERLQADGHEIATTKRHHIISVSLVSVRSTQLYRTLLHEIGHHVDYSRNPKAFARKIANEKESFAHQYADRLREELSQKKIIPIERILDPESIEQDGLRMSDFTAI